MKYQEVLGLIKKAVDQRWSVFSLGTGPVSKKEVNRNLAQDAYQIYGSSYSDYMNKERNKAKDIKARQTPGTYFFSQLRQMPGRWLDVIQGRKPISSINNPQIMSYQQAAGPQRPPDAVIYMPRKSEVTRRPVTQFASK